jgi:hypothetical protein
MGNTFCNSKTYIDMNDINKTYQTKANGTKIRYNLYGQIHCDEKDSNGITLPAIKNNKLSAWYKNGKEHRVDKDPHTNLTLPAFITTSGNKAWYKNGLLHRDEIDPVTGKELPAVILKDGSKVWYKNGIHSNENSKCKSDLKKYFQ